VGREEETAPIRGPWPNAGLLQEMSVCPQLRIVLGICPRHGYCRRLRRLICLEVDDVESLGCHRNEVNIADKEHPGFIQPGDRILQTQFGAKGPQEAFAT
jgi:hypothetical protein